MRVAGHRVQGHLVMNTNPKNIPLTAAECAPHIVTIVRDPKRRLGKQIDIGKDGKLKKHSVVDVAVGIAEQRHVPDAEAFAAVLREVSEDEHAAILNSYFADIPVGQRFLILSESEMEHRGLGETREQREGVKLGTFEVKGEGAFEIAVGRLKCNLRPSSWQLLDRDVDEHTPHQFGQGMDRAAWLRKAAEMLPGLATACRVFAASASARVLRDGQPVGSGNGHTWVRVQDAADVERTRLALLQRAHEVGAVWQKPKHSRKTGEVLGSVATTIMDLSVLIPGRLVFCGKPYAPELTVQEQRIEIENPHGGAVATDLVQLNREEFKRLTREAGAPMTVRGDSTSLAIDAYDLNLDTELELEDGRVVTVASAVELLPEGGKLRCQAPFRASVSMAAAFRIGKDGRPCVHDVGTGTTHWLNDDEQMQSEAPNLVDESRAKLRQLLRELESGVADLIDSDDKLLDQARECKAMLPEAEVAVLDVALAPVLNATPDQIRQETAPTPSPNDEPALLAYAYDVLQLKPVEFVVDGFLANGLTVIAGAPGVGKTSLLVPLAAAVAHLYDTILAPILRRKVIYFSESPNQVQTVLFGLARHADGAKPHQFPEWFRIVPSRRLQPKALGKLIKRVVKDHTLERNGYPVAPLIVLDTSNANIELENENDNAEGGRAMAAIKENLGTGACWLVCHTPKAQRGASADDLTIRGAGAFEGDAETTAFIAAEDGVLDKRFMKLGKHRYVPTVHELEFDTDVDTEVVPTPWGEPQEIIYRYGIPSRSSTAARKAQVAVAKEVKAAGRKTEMADRILDFLRENGPSSMRQVHQHIRGKHQPLYDLMRQMDEDGRLERSGEFCGGHPVFQAPAEFAPISGKEGGL